MLDPRLIAAEVLKLRRRRGMLAISLVLTLGLMAVVLAVMAIQHGGNPARYGPAGGLANYRDDIGVVALMGLVVGAIIGATAGTQDIEAGVFREVGSPVSWIRNHQGRSAPSRRGKRSAASRTPCAGGSRSCADSGTAARRSRGWSSLRPRDARSAALGV
jgi:hypothetical protein